MDLRTREVPASAQPRPTKLTPHNDQVTLPLHRPPDLDERKALRWALAALRTALEKHEAARHRPLNEAAWVAAFSSMAEASCWIAALDECLCTYHDGGLGKKGSGHFAGLRNANDRGKYIEGLLWARDRHMHQLGLTTARDTSDFYTPPAGGLFYISAGFIGEMAMRSHLRIVQTREHGRPMTRCSPASRATSRSPCARCGSPRWHGWTAACLKIPTGLAHGNNQFSQAIRRHGRSGLVRCPKSSAGPSPPERGPCRRLRTSTSDPVSGDWCWR
jgi:hypothetical protein